MRDELTVRKASGLRARPVPQADCLMVFSPLSGKIHWLGLNTWLLFELCDGRTIHEVERGYAELAGEKLGDGDAHRQVRRGLDSLLSSRLIETVPAQSGQAITEQGR
ncbi:hypothetical protein [Lysobacter sp. CA199]|uniref:hypothetical protein n=1 Tax=Lysobacter sp. CA199 TaxID=3455608 RepID=UPI003F8D1E59